MSTAAAIIEKCGGVRATAAMLAIAPSTVQSWKLAGLIPAKHQAHLLAVAQSRGIALKPDDFFALAAPAAKDAAA